MLGHRDSGRACCSLWGAAVALVLDLLPAPPHGPWELRRASSLQASPGPGPPGPSLVLAVARMEVSLGFSTLPPLEAISVMESPFSSLSPSTTRAVCSSLSPPAGPTPSSVLPPLPHFYEKMSDQMTPGPEPTASWPQTARHCWPSLTPLAVAPHSPTTQRP